MTANKNRFIKLIDISEGMNITVEKGEKHRLINNSDEKQANSVFDITSGHNFREVYIIS